MTQQEFDNTNWSGNMSLKYQGKVYDIASVNFEERLVAYCTEFDDDLSWARCETVTLIGVKP